MLHGTKSVKTEQYNGTAWTEVNDLNSARRTQCRLWSTTTSALTFGGEDSEPDSFS